MGVEIQLTCRAPGWGRLLESYGNLLANVFCMQCQCKLEKSLWYVIVEQQQDGRYFSTLNTDGIN